MLGVLFGATIRTHDSTRPQTTRAALETLLAWATSRRTGRLSLARSIRDRAVHPGGA